jgi:hypothetical protein
LFSSIAITSQPKFHVNGKREIFLSSFPLTIKSSQYRLHSMSETTVNGSDTKKDELVRFDLAEGKYTMVQDYVGIWSALRHGEPWRDCAGDNLIFHLANEVAEARLRIPKLEAAERRLRDLMPLFEEARDALPAISTTAARLRGVRLDLADRMDAVGDYEQWKAHDNARQALTKTNVRS